LACHCQEYWNGADWVRQREEEHRDSDKLIPGHGFTA
jgi:hypothetical protein